MTANATTVALPKLGTTLFSLTLEMRQPGYTLEGMIGKVAELGLGPGLEMVGFQSLRGYPRVSGEVISSFRDQCERTGLEPSAMSMNLDLGIHRGRLLDEDEALDYLEPQIAVSREMGFPVCKSSVIPTRSFLEGLVRILEKNGDMKFGYEIHSPEAVDSAAILTLRELYEAIGSPLLGFTPDFSSSMRSVPPGLIAAHRESGMSPELTDLAIEVWNSDTAMPQKFERFAAEAPALGATPADMGKLQMMLTMHGQAGPAPLERDHRPRRPRPRQVLRHRRQRRRAVHRQWGDRRRSPRRRLHRLHLQRVGGPRLHRRGQRLGHGHGSAPAAAQTFFRTDRQWLTGAHATSETAASSCAR